MPDKEPGKQIDLYKLYSDMVDSEGDKLLDTLRKRRAAEGKKPKVVEDDDLLPPPPSGLTFR